MEYARLKKAKKITAVLRGGKRVYADTLAFVYSPSKEAEMAVCVGKKYGKSVQRNRIKRLLREAFRASRQIGPYSVLLIPKKAEDYSFAAFKRDIEKIIGKEKLGEDRTA